MLIHWLATICCSSLSEMGTFRAIFFRFDFCPGAYSNGGKIDFLGNVWVPVGRDRPRPEQKKSALEAVFDPSFFTDQFVRSQSSASVYLKMAGSSSWMIEFIKRRQKE